MIRTLEFVDIMMDYGFLLFGVIVIFLPSMIIAMLVDESDLHIIPRIIMPLEFRWYNPRVSGKGLIYCCITTFALLLIWGVGLSSYAIFSVLGLIEVFPLIIGASAGFLIGNTLGYYLRPYTEDYRWSGKDSWQKTSPWEH
ncbi:MAG: hypothetical protein KGD60_09050 [Candidatus Thorarchaeota archaeon]|nr:hypothetical protein [Candidatus Thorarchaeota archaeon]